MENILAEGYGIMPNLVLFNKDLLDKEKLLYCLISSLCAKEGYSWATNEYLGDKLGFHKDTVSKYISNMRKMSLVFLEEVNNTRYITICKIDVYAKGGRRGELGGVDVESYPIYRMNSTIEKDNVIEESKTSQIEENPIKPKRKKASSSIRDVSESIRAPYVPPTIQQLHEILGDKKGVNKFYEIITLEIMKEEITLEKTVEVYNWMLTFFKEKYEGKIYKDPTTDKMVGSNIILDELDKFIAYYSEKGENILCLKARLRKWVTNSTKYSN